MAVGAASAVSAAAASTGWVRLLVATAFGVAATAGLLLALWRRRLRGHLVPGVSPDEARVLWAKDDIYDEEGRALLARCGFALEVGLAGGALGGLLLLLL